ncbi:AGE family epimerase/isomerase, partial [Brachybacterium sp. p3-SID957]|uniref:AGE family epimerase/isomerase n=1 Tax=Brachybacterium sp. p3-SID957 TaxID=2916049 RepID=UPI00223B6FF4
AAPPPAPARAGGGAHGPDDVHGGVLTCWDNLGTQLVSTDKYTWSQGRWAWLTARVALAARAGVLDVDGERYAAWSVSTSRFVRDHALLPDGRLAYLTDRAGQPRPAERGGLAASVFADLFAALGFAGTALVDPDGGWGALADDVLTRSSDLIAAGAAPTEPYPVPAGHGSLALPMMLLGVGEQVHRVTGSAASAAVVARAGEEIAARHVAGDDVAEMPPTDPSRQELLVSRHRTPGHALELVWFALHARDLLGGTGLDDVGTLTRCALRACEHGWDTEHGGLLRYVDVDGGPPRGERLDDPYEQLVTDTWDTKLWWPHAEAMYALRLLETLTGDAEIANWADRVVDYTLATFPEGPGREWTQIRTRTGAPLEKVVALPVKDPFHVARALLLLAELEAGYRPVPTGTAGTKGER